MKKLNLLLLSTALVTSKESPQGLSQSSKLDKLPKAKDVLKMKWTVNEMTLLEKFGQMTQVLIHDLMNDKLKLDKERVKRIIIDNNVGSVFSTPYFFGNRSPPSIVEWQTLINPLQQAAQKTRLKIPLVYGLDSIHGGNFIHGATLLPHQLGLASSFNRTAASLGAEITAKEMKLCGIQWNFSPNVDVAVNKIWPRLFETFGEDPYLVSELGVAMVKGYQKHNVAATLKHFIGYSGSHTGKNRDSVWISDRDLYDYFLPPFKAGIDAGALSIMESYSDINGEPIISSRKYLRDLLRDRLKFTEILVTDFNQTSNLHRLLKAASSYKDAIRQVLKVGSIDVHMLVTINKFIDFIEDLVAEDPELLHDINKSVERILSFKQKLGLENNSGVVAITPSVNLSDNQKYALDITRQSVILLENNGVLPLNKSMKLIVTGPTANSLAILSGGWTSAFNGTFHDDYFTSGQTIYQGFTKYARVTLMPSLDIKDNLLDYSVDDIIKASENADAIVLCLGEKPYVEFLGEIDSLALPSAQSQLMSELLDKSTKPVIVVLIEGRPRTLPKTTKDPAAILVSFLPGPYGGEAIADILFGTVNPSGKLPITYANQPSIPKINYYHRVSDRLHSIRWPFGHGLSYSKLHYSNITLSSQTITASTSITLSFNVTNLSPKHISHESILVYISDTYRTIIPERQLLKHFEKVTLNPLQTKSVNFEITIKDLQFHNNQLELEAELGEFHIKVQDQTVAFQLIASPKLTYRKCIRNQSSLMKN